MGPNEDLENPREDYVPPLDAMVRVMHAAPPDEVTDDWESDDWQERHEAMDQTVRNSHPVPERRHCYRCESQRWVSFGLKEPEGEDPRCAVCRWQICICGACGCNKWGAK